MSKPIKKQKKIQSTSESNAQQKKFVNSYISEITTQIDNLQNLSTESDAKITERLDLYNFTNKNINELEDCMEKIKNDFYNIKSKPVTDIDSVTYQKYINNINSLFGEIDADTDIEILIDKYTDMINNNASCQNFLKSKQMKIIYCDEKNDE